MAFLSRPPRRSDESVETVDNDGEKTGASRYRPLQASQHHAQRWLPYEGPWVVVGREDRRPARGRQASWQLRQSKQSGGNSRSRRRAQSPDPVKVTCTTPPERRVRLAVSLILITEATEVSDLAQGHLHHRGVHSLLQRSKHRPGGGGGNGTKPFRRSAERDYRVGRQAGPLVTHLGCVLLKSMAGGGSQCRVLQRPACQAYACMRRQNGVIACTHATP